MLHIFGKAYAFTFLLSKKHVLKVTAGKPTDSASFVHMLSYARSHLISVRHDFAGLKYYFHLYDGDHIVHCCMVIFCVIS